jgi:hypothetical protein
VPHQVPQPAKRSPPPVATCPRPSMASFRESAQSRANREPARQELEREQGHQQQRAPSFLEQPGRRAPLLLQHRSSLPPEQFLQENRW